ncbi:MAG: serine/threonine-protein kinase [Myxococcota bacterium]
MLQSGEVVDRYAIERVLGQGGMAVVYLVTHQQLGSQHALKVLTVGSKAITERMLQEGRVQARLRHPNIVAVHDVLDIAGQPGLLMEYVDGPSLDGFLMKHPHPEPSLAFELFLGTLEAVAYAHEQGLVHRDMKPGNILLQRVADRWIPKVTDFGLAKLVEGDQNLSKTRSGVAMGTPAYMSPEQIRDAKTVDARGDVFALGCILYELYTGAQAFYGEDILEIFNKVAAGDFTAPRELNPDIPDAVEACILGALRTRKEERIPDCSVMRDVLLGKTTRWNRRVPSQETFVGDEGALANPTLLPSDPESALQSAFPSGSELHAPENAARHVPQNTVLRPHRSAQDTVLRPEDADAPIAPRLQDMTISQTTMEPYPSASSGSPLLLVVGVGLLVILAMGVGGYVTAQLVRSDRGEPVEQPVPAPLLVPEVAPAPEPAPEPQPVAPEPAPAPVVAPAAPEPVAAPQPAQPVPAGRLAGKYRGIAGSDTAMMTVERQTATSFDATLWLRGRQVQVSGRVDGESLHFSENDGPMVFRGTLRDDGRMQGTWTRTEGAAGAQWFLQPQ